MSICSGSFKMANFKCGSAQIEVYGNNAYNRDIDATFVSGVTVNVSTTNDDGHVTYQTITIAYDRIQEVISCSGLIIKSPSPTPTRLFFFLFFFEPRMFSTFIPEWTMLCLMFVCVCARARARVYVCVCVSECVCN